MNLQFPPAPSKDQSDLQKYKPDKNSVPPAIRKAMENVPPEKAYKNIANNFYTIAALSFINSIIFAFGARFVFVVGLGFTQLVDGIIYVIKQHAGNSEFIFTAIGLIFDFGTCTTVAVFGYFTSKREHWALVIGMVLYALDALLTLIFKDWIGFAFHLFFLWQIWASYRILQYWKKLEAQSADSAPQNIGIS